MWVPKSLKVVKFMSHRETLYQYSEGVATMIYGVNKDDDAQESNGSGKSVLIEGIAMSLLGTPLRDARAVDLIMDGQDVLEVESIWYNTLFKREMTICRRVPIKGSSTLAISINGEDQKDNIPTVRDGDAFILEQLDITKEDLLNYFIISKEKYVSFFAFGDTKKKAVVARFSSADIIDPVFDAVKGDIKELEANQTVLDRQKDRLQGQLDALNEQLTSVDGKWDRQAVITQLKDRIKSGSALLKDKQNQLTTTQQTLLDATSALQSFDKIDFDGLTKDLNRDLATKRKCLNDAKEERRESDNFVHELEHIIAGTIECPNCKHKFVLGEDVDAKEAATMLPDARKMLERIETTITQCDASVVEVERDLLDVREKERQQVNKWTGLDQAKTNAERNYEVVNDEIHRYQRGLDQIRAELDEVVNRKVQDVRKPLKDKITVLNKEYKQLLKSAKLLDEEKGDCVEWEYRFRRFKSYLANKAIASIEAFTTYYLQQMNTNLGLKLSGYKVKANGELSEKITATVMRNGLPVAGFGRFSGGEKVRVEICNIIALQGLINLNSKSGGLDLLCLDEIIESVDGKGVTELMKALSLLNKTVLVITHTTHTGVYDHVVTVVKCNGSSKIAA